MSESGARSAILEHVRLVRAFWEPPTEIYDALALSTWAQQSE